LADENKVVSDDGTILTFGNGPDRSLENREVGGQILGIDFNRHTERHVIRATQEGIAFSFNYGLKIMKAMGLDIGKIRVGLTNMFLSPVFTEAFTNTTGVTIERFQTDGSQGAAIGAGIGAGVFENREDAFASLEKVDTVEPDKELQKQYQDAYHRWEETLNKQLTR